MGYGTRAAVPARRFAACPAAQRRNSQLCVLWCTTVVVIPGRCSAWRPGTRGPGPEQGGLLDIAAVYDLADYQPAVTEVTRPGKTGTVVLTSPLRGESHV